MNSDCSIAFQHGNNNICLTHIKGYQFSFNGKEKDNETYGDGNEYDFDARIYNPRLGVWLSIDPLFKLHVYESPYVSFANSPILFKDPDGQKVVFAPGTSNEFKQKFATAIKYMNAHGTAGNMAALQKSNTVYQVSETHGGVNSFDPKTKTINWNANLAKGTNTNAILSPSTLLGHEADHANQFDKHKDQFIKDQAGDAQYDTKEERRVITGSEQRTALKHGEIKKGEITREDHKFKSFIPVSNPTSTGDIIITDKKFKK